MNKVRVVGGALLFLCVLLCFSISIGYGDDENEEQRKVSYLWVWERLRSAYSMYSSLFPGTNIGNYWHMVKAFLSHAYALFFPPNIDFRRGDEVETVAEDGGVKEAISKSIGKSKATLEDVAKSAANIAKDKVVNNKKKTSLSKNRESEHQNEL
ncbi:hypothetical protein TanjilG_32836 [Lupinus angustifolius]|uniref:Transmembrane protein n=2 Tax=Lupinus angustifolius TaxID=3871 RepID=A0A4P1RSC1_LUPAN|nr:hypothetical protein TanjilG_32836 [Lupinus angustifolius]